MNELELYKYIGHKLPKIPHMSGIVNRVLKPIYNRKERGFTISDVLGLKMELDPRECVDGNLLFCPQLYESYEIEFILETLSDKDTFIDVGSHIGFYSLMATKKIEAGKIIAIEASPVTFKRLKKNIELNNVNISAVNSGVSDKKEVLNLSIHTGTNAGGQSFIENKEGGIKVKCYPLIHILKEFKINKIKIMKLDIEGYEYKVLKHFLENAKMNLFPKFIITEFFETNIDNTTGNQIELLKDYDYQEISISLYNRILKLNDF